MSSRPTEISQPERVAVIGAGMAGLTLAHLLKRAGCSVLVLEKGSRPGGRLASPVFEEDALDWGTQFFTVRNPRFQTFLNEYAGDSYAVWDAPLRYRTANEQWEAFRGETRYVARRSMDELSQALAAGIEIRYDCNVSRLRRRRDGQWMALDTSGKRHEAFDTLALALPPASAWQLCTNSGLREPAAQLQPLSSTLGLCQAVALHFAQATGLGWQGYQMATGPLQWACNNSSKPGRSRAGEWWMLHGSAAWSTQARGWSDSQVIDRLLSEFMDLTGCGVAPRGARVHFWPFAKSQRKASTGQLLWPELRLGICGDWLYGGRLEAAFESAESLAEVWLA